MAETHLYGQRFRDSFRIEQPRTLSTRTLSMAEISVSECQSDDPEFGLSDKFPEDDAFIVGLQLRDYPDCENWEGDRFISKTDVYAGETHLYDVRNNPQFVIDKPIHGMFFYIPRAAFDSIADQSGVPRIESLSYRPGIGHADEVVKNLGASIFPALAEPEQANRLFVDHVTLAVAAHVAQTYGGLLRVAPPTGGGLADWQRKRALEMLDASLGGETPLKDIAAECGLSVSHFSRAFRRSMGIPPHKWLLLRRVDVAKTMMMDRRLSLSQIALSAGFANQSHFTRVFSRMVGISPGTWRRHTCGQADNDLS